MPDLFDAGKPAPKKRGPRPKCPDTPCGHGTVAVLIDAEQRHRGCPEDHRLACAACGDTFRGTDAEVAQATAADAAWERKQVREERAWRRARA